MRIEDEIALLDRLPEAIHFFEKDGKIGKVRTITPLSGGTSNDLFLVNNAFVVRLKNVNPTDGPFNLPKNEVELYRTVNELRGVAPLCYVFNGGTGDKIEVFIHNAEPLVKEGESIEFTRLLSCIDTMKKLHVPAKENTFQAKERFNHYKKLSKTKLPEKYEKKILTQAYRILENRPIVLSHNDLWSGNILFNGKGHCYFIDFEFGGGNADYFDLASLLEENCVDGEMREHAIAYYFNDPDDLEKELVEINILMTYLDALWFYWAKARYIDTGDESFNEISKTKRDRFLAAFDLDLMEG